MLKSKEELEKYLESKIHRITTDTELCVKICDDAKEKYNIPRGITSDYLTFRTSLQEATEFILFCLLDVVSSKTNCKKDLDNFYTEQEIRTYQNASYEVGKIKFPLRFKVIKITEDQWVGRIDFDMLMKLRAAQLINYNENAQRTMQRVIKGDKTAYKIKLNQTAVNAIENLFRKRIYIPTPFTLNIPQEVDSNFYYDDDANELVIKSLEHFDIADGYHRYIAACRINNTDPDFNYTMELRIVNFSDEKAKQFIFQEDQKTKMTKIDSDAFDMYKASNIVVNRINETSQCNLQGLISNNNGIINLAELSGLIQYFYFKDATSKEKEKVAIISTTKELIEDFNMLTEYDTYYLEKPYTYKQLTIVMCVFNYFKDKDKSNMCKILDVVIKKADKLDPKKFYHRTPKKVTMNDIEKIIKEEELCIMKH